MGPHKPQKEKKKGLLELKLFCTMWQLIAHLKHLKFLQQCGLTLWRRPQFMKNILNLASNHFFLPPASRYRFTLVL